MADYQKKKGSIKGKILTVIVGIVGVVYWMIGKAENALETLSQNS